MLTSFGMLLLVAGFFCLMAAIIIDDSYQNPKPGLGWTLYTISGVTTAIAVFISTLPA